VSTHYVSGNMAVAGVGVDHDTLAELVKKMPVREGPQPAVMQKAKYHGGDIFMMTAPVTSSKSRLKTHRFSQAFSHTPTYH